jgi:hypothetical protein
VVVQSDYQGAHRTPCGFKVEGRNRSQLRTVAEGLLPILRAEGCYSRSSNFLDTKYLLENVLHRAGYAFHVDDSGDLTETVAFAIPEKRLIVLRHDIYDRLQYDDPFARYTVVHEFSHIVLEHAVTLHRGAVLGQHDWWEDSEWQANNLTAEILMPVAVIKSLEAKPLLIEAECGVSSKAVSYRLANLRKENLI